MICEGNVKEYCSGDITKIENYDKAISDKTQTRQCHHRLGEHMTQQELMDNGLYYQRPPEELKFLTAAEHSILHIRLYPERYEKSAATMRGRTRPEEVNAKVSKSLMGHDVSPESRKKMSIRKMGNNNAGGHEVSEEARRAISMKKIGKHRYNNGVVRVLRDECPEGFVSGWNLNRGKRKWEDHRNSHT